MVEALIVGIISTVVGGLLIRLAMKHRPDDFDLHRTERDFGPAKQVIKELPNYGAPDLWKEAMVADFKKARTGIDMTAGVPAIAIGASSKGDGIAIGRAPASTDYLNSIGQTVDIKNMTPGEILRFTKHD